MNLTGLSKSSAYFYIGTLSLAIMLLFSSRCPAQHYNLSQYTETNGLGSSSVYDISQDSIGRIWFATRGGITSFDGSDWKSYNSQNGLASSGYGSVEIDEKGFLWSLPIEGPLFLTRFNGKNWERVFRNKKDEKYYSFNSLLLNYENDEPVVLIGTDNEGVLVNRQGKWATFNQSNGLLSNAVIACCFLEDSIIVATQHGVNIIYDNTVSKLDYSNWGLPDDRITGLFTQKNPGSIKDSIVWMTGKNWLGYISDRKFKLVSSKIETVYSLDKNIDFLVPDRSEGIYYGNSFSLNHYDFVTKNITSLGKKNGLIADGASNAFIDREKNLWIATGRGVNKIGSKRFTNFYEEDGLFEKEVTSVVEISPGKLVFGHIGALTYYENGVFEVLEFPSSSASIYTKRVMDLAVQDDKYIWVAAGLLGIGQIDPNKMIRWFSEKEGIMGEATSVISTRNGDIYASSNKGLYILNGDKFKEINYTKLQSVGIRKLFETRDGSLYLTTFRNGIFKIKDGVSINLTYQGQSIFNSTYSILETPTGEILVGSAMGFLKVQDSALVNYDEIPLARPIYMTIYDESGQMWIGSDNGIYRLSGSELTNFSIIDGLTGNDINRDAGFLDSENNLWFGTNNGLTLYRKKYDIINNTDIPPPNVSLSFVETDGENLKLNENITLDHHKNNLSFHFKGISFIDENQVYYQCRLEGFEDEWSDEFRSLQNSIRYSNLKPGEYRFCVKARNALGVWSEPICSGQIQIKSPLYVQWWFIVLTALMIAWIIIVISRTINHRKYAGLLEKTVKIRTNELNAAKEKAEESDRLKSAFLANMSHEIRTPMNGILGFTQLLKEADLAGKDRLKYVDIIEESGDRMLNTINDIIDFSRIESGEVVVDIKPTDINSILGSLFDFFIPEATIKNLKFTFKPDPNYPSPIILTDPEKLYAIFTNLIKNALKFTTEGIIEFGYTIEDSDIHYYVKDTGKGIGPDNLKTVFDRFIQEDDSPTRMEQGSGLGLSIVKAYVALMNGKIWVESEKGEGSTFHFLLPFKLTENETLSSVLPVKEDNKPEIKNNLIKKRILIVEDDEASYLYLKVLLTGYGFNNIDRVDNGEDSIKYCKDHPDVQLILMDINLPVMTGYDAAKSIKSFNPGLPIIAQTAYALDGDNEKALNSGCDDYITKPIKKDKLFEKLEKHLN